LKEKPILTIPTLLSCTIHTCHLERLSIEGNGININGNALSSNNAYFAIIDIVG